MAYPEVEISDVCSKCQQACMMPNKNITEITVTKDPYCNSRAPTNYFPMMGNQAPKTSQFPTTSKSQTITVTSKSQTITVTSQSPTTAYSFYYDQITWNGTVSVDSSKSMRHAWIAIGSCVGVVTLILVTLLIRCLIINIKTQHTTPANDVSIMRKESTESDRDIGLALSSHLHDVIILYHTGNKQKAMFSRIVVVQGLRDMHVDCTSPEYEDAMNSSIPNWVKHTLDSVRAVVAVCCEEFYNAFWENGLLDHESRIVSEFARQLKGRRGFPQFISVITRRDEQKYVPDMFRDQASIVCLQSHEDFDKLLRIINDVAPFELTPLGPLPRNRDISVEDDDEYTHHLKKTWDKVKRNFVANLHECNSARA